MPARLPPGVIEVAGVRLTLAEAAVMRHLSAKRLLVAAPNAWGTFAMLKWLAFRGAASQCGRLFHVMPACDRIVAALPPVQVDAFGADVPLQAEA